jgi:hypothetical protein
MDITEKLNICRDHICNGDIMKMYPEINEIMEQDMKKLLKKFTAIKKKKLNLQFMNI